MPSASPLDVARRFFAAVVSGDLETVREIYAPDAVIWHNTDGATQTREENLVVLAAVQKQLEDFRYEHVRVQRTDNGFVQQHVVRGRDRSSGRELDLPAVIVCEVRDGRVTRLDEYFDSEPLARVFPALARPRR